MTEATWLKPDPPQEIRDFWQQAYPEMKTLEENLDVIHDCGYYLIDYFVLPETSWSDEYYKPMQERINLLRERYQHDPQKLSILDEESVEIQLYKKYSEYYGYVFYLMQNNAKEQKNY